MKQERVIYIKELFATQMNHWILFSVVMTILGLTGCGKPGFLPWVPLSLLPFLMFLIRRNIKDRILFVLGSIGIAAVFAVFSLFVISERAAQVLACIVVAGYFIYSCVMRFALKDRLSAVISPVIGMVIVGVGLFIQRTWGWKEGDIFYIVLAAVILGLHFMNMFVKNFLQFLEANGDSAGRIPAREIFSSGIGITAIFAVGGIGILLLSSRVEWLGTILNGIWEGIVNFLRKLNILKEIETNSSETASGLPSMTDMLLPDNSGAVTSVFAQILQKVLIVAGTVAAVALVIFGICKIVEFLRSYQKDGTGKATAELNSMDDTREKVQVEKRRSKQGSPFGFLSYRERIRKQYKKKILSEKNRIIGTGDKELLSYRTARECGNIIEDQELVRAYEKARYTEDACTAGDLKLAKG